ncbi:MAG: SDR family oxidoreductase, partial [Anaerolineae bacterium]|nr:SDR family oxidoreductase [Anaerolineae bacterium]
MRVLFIGGTGFISTAVSRLALAQGFELYHLNRGTRQAALPGVQNLIADVHQPEQAQAALQGLHFDVVVDWIAYTPEDIERDLLLFRGKVKQFIFISSASAYQKPPTYPIITESTPLHNPYWDYSRNKIACEERLLRAYREEAFPATIVRPSLTYDSNFPIAIGGWGCYTLADRLKTGKPIIVHGDGSSLWVVTHAEDFGRGFLGLVGNEQALGHAFHITSDEVLTWEQIYRTIADALGVEAHIVHIPSDFIAKVAPQLGAGLLGDKTWSVIFDNSKIKTFAPGFQAIIPFREGIR